MTETQPKKKLSKRSRAIIFIAAVVGVLISTAIIAYMNYLHSTGRVTAGLYAVRNDRNDVPMVNFFIMEAGDKYIAFDAGYESEQVEKSIELFQNPAMRLEMAEIKLNLSPNRFLRLR